MKIFKKLAFALLLISLPSLTMAWGQLGHRVIGEIADFHLSKSARKEVRNILGHETLAMSANWGDFIKSNSKFSYLYNWHFINFPAGLNDEQFKSYLKADTITDAFTKINFMVDQLKDKNLTQENKVLYLRMLVHIVGDIHQPMHTGHKEDLGGNKVELTWFGEKTNLHRVWDDQLISSQELSFTEYAGAINYLSKKEATVWQKGTIQEWLHDSYGLSTKIYDTTKPNDKLGYKYIYDYIGIANNQMLKGGVHLAQLLNEIFA